MRVKHLRLLAAALCCVLGAACGPGTPSRSAAGGGTVVVGLGNVGSLDPPRAEGLAALSLLRTACDAVAGLEVGNHLPQPALAAEWSLTSFSRVMEIRLREGLQFQDGTEVTAPAIREAISRVARPDTASPWSGLVAKVEGYDAVTSGEATHLSGVRILDDYHLQIRLAVPASEFPMVLSHPALTPVSLASLRESPEGSPLPVCAGPYRIEAGINEPDLVLTRTAEYRSHNEAYLRGGEGTADLILIRSFESEEDAYQAFASGEVDLAGVPDSRLTEAQTLGSSFQSAATPEVSYLGFAPGHALTGSPQFRQAVSVAIDRLAIIDAVFGDRRDPAGRWLQPDYAPEVETTCAGVMGRISDPRLAGELLMQSGVDPASVTLPLYYPEQGSGRLVAEGVEVQVEAALGIDVVPTPVQALNIAAVYDGSKPGLWLLTNRAELPLPDQALGDPFRTGGSRNVLGLSEPEFDELVFAAERAESPDEVAALYAEAENVLCRLMPAIPLWRSVGHWVVDGRAVIFEGDHSLGALGFPLLRHARGIRE